LIKTRPFEQPLQSIDSPVLAYPGSHAHAELPRAAVECVPHGTHAVAPRVAAYVFSAQSKQERCKKSAPDLYLPAGHALQRYAETGDTHTSRSASARIIAI
jgi:hypothetical protein